MRISTIDVVSNNGAIAAVRVRPSHGNGKPILLELDVIDLTRLVEIAKAFRDQNRARVARLDQVLS